MSGEIKSWWQARIANLEKDRFFNKRYASCAKESKALFDRIGEDLDSSNESIRNGAYWAVVHLTPELINILHEKEIRNPGWQDIEGKDQKIVNEGIDGSKCILKHLHTKLVKEHDFKVRDGNKKDPRPYLKKAMDNWKEDAKRKRRREVPLDYEAALKIPDPAGFPEIKTEIYDDLWREYKIFFRDRDAFDVFIAHQVDERPLEEIRERWGIPSDKALRQRKSRINKNMVAVRDTIFSVCLMGRWGFSTRGKFPRFPSYPEWSEWWAERAKRSVQPGAWLDGKVADGKNAVAIRALTTGLRHAPAHIYLLATHKYKDYRCKLYYDTRPDTQPLSKQLSEFAEFVSYDVITLDDYYLQYVDKLINLTSRGLQPNRYMYRLLDAYPTELPGINEAIAEVRDNYNIWLITNSLRIHVVNGYRKYAQSVT